MSIEQEIDQAYLDEEWFEVDRATSLEDRSPSSHLRAVRGHDFTARVIEQAHDNYVLEAPTLPLSHKILLHRRQVVGASNNQVESTPLSLGQEVVVKVLSYNRRLQAWFGSMNAVALDLAIKAALSPDATCQAVVVDLGRKHITVRFADRFFGYIPSSFKSSLLRYADLQVGENIQIRVAGWGKYSSGPVVLPTKMTAAAVVVGVKQRLTKKGRCLRIATELSASPFGRIVADVTHLYNAIHRLPIGKQVRVTVQPGGPARGARYSGTLEPFDEGRDAAAEAQGGPFLCFAHNRLDYGMFCVIGDGREALLHFASQPEGAAKEAALQAQPGDWLRVVPLQAPNSTHLSLQLVP